VQLTAPEETARVQQQGKTTMKPHGALQAEAQDVVRVVEQVALGGEAPPSLQVEPTHWRPPSPALAFAVSDF
jgi:hypothetical protein